MRARARRNGALAGSALLIAGMLGACAKEPLTREEAEYPESLVIPPEVVDEPEPSAAGDSSADSSEAGAEQGLPVDAARTIPSRISTEGEVPRLELDMGVNEAWRSAGVALNRLGFTVLERARDNLYYAIRYDPHAGQDIEQPGLFARWLGDAERIDTSPQRYRLQIETEGATALVLRDAQGEPAPAQVAERVLILVDRQLY